MAILNPVGEERILDSAIVPRISSLAGKKIALLGNLKPNGRELLLRTGQLLTTEKGVVEVKLFEKESASFGAPENLIAEIASQL
jgi:hypothetical protein